MEVEDIPYFMDLMQYTKFLHIFLMKLHLILKILCLMKIQPILKIGVLTSLDLESCGRLLKQLQEFIIQPTLMRLKNQLIDQDKLEFTHQLILIKMQSAEKLVEKECLDFMQIKLLNKELFVLDLGLINYQDHFCVCLGFVSL